MSPRRSDRKQLHVRARTLSQQRMQAYYPEHPQYLINRVDPAMWAIIYQATLKELQEETGIPEYDWSAEADRARGPKGQFLPASQRSNAT